MTSTKLIVALALLLSATSATLAKSRTYYDFASGAQSGDTHNAPSGYDPTEESQR